MRQTILRGVVRAAAVLVMAAAAIAFLVTLLFTFTLLVYYNPTPLGVVLLPIITALLGSLTYWFWHLYRRM